MRYRIELTDQSNGECIPFDGIGPAEAFEGTAEIVGETGTVLAAMHVSQPANRNFVAALVGQMLIDGSDAETVYTSGGCDLLALALFETVEGGNIVAVVDPCYETGEPMEGKPYLIHAGLLVGDMVLDVHGLSPVEDWTVKWAALGGMDCFLDYPDAGSLAAAVAGREASLDQARGVAALVAAANGIAVEAAARAADDVACRHSA